MVEDIEKRVSQYVQVRDMIRDTEERHKKELEPLKGLLNKLGGTIQKFMDTNNITDSLKTDSGTAIISTKYSASLADPETFMNFVIEQKRFELMDRRANSTAVRDYVQENNELPPGCNLSAVQTLSVRRGSGK